MPDLYTEKAGQTPRGITWPDSNDYAKIPTVLKQNAHSIDQALDDIDATLAARVAEVGVLEDIEGIAKKIAASVQRESWL